MSNTIYRPDPADDFFVVWNNNSDQPECWGPQAEVVGYLVERELEGLLRKAMKAPFEVAERVKRVIERGTSSRASVLVGSYGSLPVEGIRAYLDTYDAETGAFDHSLVTPHDDFGAPIVG